LPKEARLMTSIPLADWQINADDPAALTRLRALPEFHVTHLELAAEQATLVLHCLPVQATAACPTCGQPSAALHQAGVRTVRDLPWAGWHCFVQFPARRFFCHSCARPFSEPHAALAPYARTTRRYAADLFAQCRAATIQQVAQREGLGYKAVEGIFYQRAAHEHPPGPPAGLVRRLGLDEIALHKGHGNYALVVTDLNTGCVLDELPDRTQATIRAYFATWTPEQRAAVREVALDLWAPYHAAVQAALPQARITADRFHVMQQLNSHLTEARREIQRALPPAERKHLKGSRWLLVKNEADLTPPEQEQLAALKAAVPQLGRLHTLKEEFRAIFEQVQERATASRRLRTWLKAVEASGLSSLAPFVRLLRKWWRVILNYFLTLRTMITS
jgi:transposase